MKPSTQGLRVIVVVVLVFVGCFVGVDAASAATYYVATNGNDASSGTVSQPFQTIKRGISVLKAGDTLHIRTGTYPESISSLSQTIPSGTSWSSPVTIAAYPGETVTLRPTTDVRVITFATAVRYIIIDNLILDGINQKTEWSDGVNLGGGANHVRFTNVEIRNSWRNGVLVVYASSGPDGTDYNEFINCRVHDNGLSGTGHGMYISTSNNLVKGSTIYNHNKYGLQVFTNYAGQRASNNVIQGNVFSGNGASSLGGTLILSSGDNNLAVNNVIFSNHQDGILIDYNGPTNTKVYHNTIYDNGYNGVRIGSGSGAIVKNNILYLNGIGTIANNGSGTVLSNNVTTDPKFANAAGRDFHVQLGSPAISAAITVSSISTDFDGAPRPQGSGPEAGAYEYQEVTSAMPAPPTNVRIVSQ